MVAPERTRVAVVASGKVLKVPEKRCRSGTHQTTVRGSSDSGCRADSGVKVIEEMVTEKLRKKDWWGRVPLPLVTTTLPCRYKRRQAGGCPWGAAGGKLIGEEERNERSLVQFMKPHDRIMRLPGLGRNAKL
jgi:hypothetical protein